MIHQEISEKVNNLSIAFSNGFGDAKALKNAVVALIQIVDLHKPNIDHPTQCDGCVTADPYEWRVYPCETLQLIEKIMND